jgi:hypothetical protein
MNIKKLNVTNVILTGILAALVFLCIDQRQGIKSTHESQDKLLSGVNNIERSIWVQNLMENGRRLAFARHFQEQVKHDFDIGKSLDLLKNGPEGINAYLSLNDNEVANAAKQFASQSALYGLQVAMGVFPQVFEGLDKKSELNKGEIVSKPILTADKLSNSLSDYLSKMWKICAPGKMLKRYQGGNSWLWVSHAPLNNFICPPAGPRKEYMHYLADKLVVKNKEGGI